jgi:hypothetical protein
MGQPSNLSQTAILSTNLNAESELILVSIAKWGVMKKSFLVAVAGLVTFGLAGCGLVPEEVSPIGISGEDLSLVTMESELVDDDQTMLYICQDLAGYTTGVRPVWDGTEPESLANADAKESLRDAADSLKSASDDLPELTIYYDGVIGELADAGSKPEGFVKLEKACRTYDNVMTSLSENYAEPVTVSVGCWNTINVSAGLYEKIGEEWEQISYSYELAPSDLCSDPNFPHTKVFYIETSLAATETRTLKFALVSTNEFSENNSTSVSSFEFEYDPTLTSPGEDLGYQALNW